MKFAPFLLTVSSLLLLFSTLASSAPSLSKFLACLPPKTNSESVFTSSNPSYQSIRDAHVVNLRFNRSTTPKPLAIVTAKSYSDVQFTVTCAKSSGLQIRIRSGGHDYEGLSYVSHVPFVILDMFNLRKISITGKTAWVESGAILGELYYAVAKQSNNTLAFPGGVCFSVGVGGHFGGGGYGNLMRKYGLTVDHVVDALVVDANGKILNRTTMGEDFFWAIRGGGAASFGVVLSWKIQLVEVPQTVTVFGVRRTLDQGATEIVLQWQQVGTQLDPNLFIRVQPQPFGSAPNSLAVMFIALYLGPADSLVTMINNRIPLLGLQASDVIEMTWAQSALYWFDSSPKGTPLEKMLNRKISANYFKNKSDFVKKPVSKAGLEALWKKMIQVGPNALLQFNTYGGRMSEIAENATPFPHRAGNLFEIQYITFWNEDSLDVENTRVTGVRALHDTFTPFVSTRPREALLNYRDLDIGTNANKSIGFALDYFKGNVRRLLHVKNLVDPTEFFKYEQSIPNIKGF